MLIFWLIFIKNAFFVAFSCFFDHLFSVTVQIQLNMPSDRSNKRDRDHSSRRSEEQDGGRRDRKRSPSRSSRESDNTSRHRHSSPVRKNSSRNLKSSDASKDRSYRNVETDELSFRRSVSRDNERSGAKDRVNSRSPSVPNELYDSFVGGFVPIDHDGRRIGPEGDALPPLSLSSKRAASSTIMLAWEPLARTRPLRRLPLPHRVHRLSLTIKFVNSIHCLTPICRGPCQV